MYQMAGSASVSDLAIVETSNTATHAIEEGSFVCWKARLCVALSDIAIGDTLDGTNLMALDSSGGALSYLNGKMNKIVNLVYPVGSIYMSVVNTSPATLFGGTWEQLKDRFLLGSGDTYSAGTTAGSATKTIETANLPSHSHGLNSHTHSVGAHSHGLNSHKHSVGAHSHGLNSHTHGVGSYAVGSGGAHTHNLHAGGASLVNGGNVPTIFAYNGSYTAIYAESAGSHSHTFSGTSGAASGSTANSTAFDSGAASGSTANSTAFDSGAATGNTANAGSGTALDIMPPYLTVYIWKRTA